MSLAARRPSGHKHEHAREAGRDREYDDGRMGFLEHLDELRTRLIRACIAVGIGMLVSFALVGKIQEIVMSSVLGALPPGTELIYIRPGEGFAFWIDLSLIGAIVLAAPAIAWQVWRFVAPGLYVNERRLVVPFVLLAVIGSIAGAAFSHYVLFPSMMTFFRGFEAPGLRFMPRLDDTFALYKNTLIGMVLVFQIPTVIYVLARIGVATPRLLWRYVRHAVLGAVIAAAVLTPSPDPWNQLAFAAPIVAMYMIGIAIAWIVQPRPRAGNVRNAADAADAEHAADADDRSAMGLVIAAAAFEQARRRRESRMS